MVVGGPHDETRAATDAAMMGMMPRQQQQRSPPLRLLDKAMQCASILAAPQPLSIDRLASDRGKQHRHKALAGRGASLAGCRLSAH